jgi:hypothetical protein
VVSACMREETGAVVSACEGRDGRRGERLHARAERRRAPCGECLHARGRGAVVSACMRGERRRAEAKERAVCPSAARLR